MAGMSKGQYASLNKARKRGALSKAKELYDPKTTMDNAKWAGGELKKKFKGDIAGARKKIGSAPAGFKSWYENRGKKKAKPSGRVTHQRSQEASRNANAMAGAIPGLRRRRAENEEAMRKAKRGR